MEDYIERIMISADYIGYPIRDGETVSLRTIALLLFHAKEVGNDGLHDDCWRYFAEFYGYC